LRRLPQGSPFGVVARAGADAIHSVTVAIDETTDGDVAMIETFAASADDGMCQ
jgi:hypothetical protein